MHREHGTRANIRASARARASVSTLCMHVNVRAQVGVRDVVPVRERVRMCVSRACARGSDGETGDANAISTTDQSSKPREAERWTPPVRARGASDWRPCKTRSRNSTVSPLSPVSPVASTRKREADFFLPFPPPTTMYHIDRRLRFPGTGYSRFISPWPRASNVIRVSCRTSVALVLTQGSLSHRIV